MSRFVVTKLRFLRELIGGEVFKTLTKIATLLHMTITSHIFEAYLKCPTKCWLKFTGEPSAGNGYAEWVRTEQESYRADAARRLIANAPADECAIAPAATNLKTAQWRFATELRSCRGHEAHTSSTETSQSLLTSAATIEVRAS